MQSNAVLNGFIVMMRHDGFYSQQESSWTNDNNMKAHLRRLRNVKSSIPKAVVAPRSKPVSNKKDPNQQQVVPKRHVNPRISHISMSDTYKAYGIDRNSVGNTNSSSHYKNTSTASKLPQIAQSRISNDNHTESQYSKATESNHSNQGKLNWTGQLNHQTGSSFKPTNISMPASKTKYLHPVQHQKIHRPNAEMHAHATTNGIERSPLLKRVITPSSSSPRQRTPIQDDDLTLENGLFKQSQLVKEMEDREINKPRFPPTLSPLKNQGNSPNALDSSDSDSEGIPAPSGMLGLCIPDGLSHVDSSVVSSSVVSEAQPTIVSHRSSQNPNVEAEKDDDAIRDGQLGDDTEPSKETREVDLNVENNITIDHQRPMTAKKSEEDNEPSMKSRHSYDDDDDDDAVQGVAKKLSETLQTSDDDKTELASSRIKTEDDDNVADPDKILDDDDDDNSEDGLTLGHLGESPGRGEPSTNLVLSNLTSDDDHQADAILGLGGNQFGMFSPGSEQSETMISEQDDEHLADHEDHDPSLYHDMDEEYDEDNDVEGDIEDSMEIDATMGAPLEIPMTECMEFRRDRGVQQLFSGPLD